MLYQLITRRSTVTRQHLGANHVDMTVHILGVGAEWWLRPGPADDRYRFTKRAAYFNTTAIMQPSSGRIRRSWAIPGVVRFNGNSGIDPHRPDLVVGSVYVCTGIEKFGGWNRLLATGKRHRTVAATHYLLAVDSSLYGRIDLRTAWRNRGVRVVSVSECQDRQQALLLLAPDGRFITSCGTWRVNLACPMIELASMICQF